MGGKKTVRMKIHADGLEKWLEHDHYTKGTFNLCCSQVPPNNTLFPIWESLCHRLPPMPAHILPHRIPGTLTIFVYEESVFHKFVHERERWKALPMTVDVHAPTATASWVTPKKVLACG